MNFINTAAKRTALILSVTAMTASAQMDDIAIHGFISQGFIVSSEYDFQSLDSKDGTFEANEIGINFRTELSDDVSVGVQLMSRDFGKAGNNQVMVDWAYGDYAFRNWLGLRAGRVKTPLGLYNETRDIDMVRNSVLLPQSIYNETYRDFQSSIYGAELYGTLPLSAAGSLQYKVQTGVPSVDTDNSGLTQVLNVGIGDMMPGYVTQDIDPGLAGSGSLIWNTPLSGFRIGASFNSLLFDVTGEATGPFGPMAVTIETDYSYSGMLSAEYTINNWIFAAEGMYKKTESELTVMGTTSPFGAENRGGYLSASYRFNDLLEVGGYGSTIRLIDRKRESYDCALCCRFDLTSNWLLKLEGHFIHGGAELTYDTTADNEDWFMFTTKTTFSF